ncbi:hypothetical protein [Neptuniibacter sp. QD37_11]|uniref:hypothetical protein n=1 Tax=Neptuniibacter sp. QD37_11 TaxID=3398209 RepID=UPI0039F5D13C
MSMRRRCSFWLATDEQWYVLLGNFEDAYEEDECTPYGPFGSLAEAEKNIRTNFSNPGGSDVDDSGSEAPPKDPEMPRNSMWVLL